ncbi:MAG: DUF192 domain-containing protein [Nanoarchaeota archaeon]|nr:DUF192 domain-containing protein [Nanoarchaeota archaeon]MBU1270063.1 DUF192 domain-containing protein [Nanoarchaeota archaeon]MBU1605008.1 DUF192 domain-containing protein [Nanoarchaeota archaeon]MBU2443399.1 DUF192 domain-containing protein [Nanoarchaeota archaeon]
MKLWFLIFCIVILISGCSEKKDVPVNYKKGQARFGAMTVDVEVADTFEKRMTGLMHQESLGEFQGMLFIFDDEVVRDFWMKNTLIPLDIIFINSSFDIVKIQHAVPCKEDSCPTYSSINSSKYVVEVNAGFAEKNNIIEGMKVELLY